MPTTRSQKKAAAVAAAELKLATPLTVDEYVYHLKSGLSFFSWYGANTVASVLENTLGRKIVGNKSLNVSRKELTTSRNWRWTTPLIMATQLPEDASELIKEMVEVHGCDPNMRDAWGMSPLYFALCAGKKKHAKVLLDAGAVLETRHYSPVGGPSFMGAWENVDLEKMFADVLAELRA
jgi:hypothetical protein